MSGVEIRVRANTQQARSELKKVEKDIGVLKKASMGLATQIKLAVSAYSGFVSTRAIVRAADDFRLLENRLKLVAEAGVPVRTTLLRLNKLAIESRTSLTNTATNYQRLARALQNTGRSSGEFLLITEAINKATKLGGQPLATQQAALFQLSQAFSSGVLRGEEFNSVSEGAPEILNALTQALGKSRAQLREMAFDGKITSDVLSDALLKQLPKIRSEFDLLGSTVGETAEIMRSEFGRALTVFDEAFGISARVAGRFEALTRVFSFVADNGSYYFDQLKLIILDFAFDTQITILRIKRAFRELFSTDFNSSNFGEALQGVSDAFNNLRLENLPTFNVDNFITGTETVLNKLETWAGKIGAVFTNLYTFIFGNSPWPAIFEDGHGESKGSISSPRWFATLEDVLSRIKSWGRRIKNTFTDIFLGVETGPGGEFREGGVADFFKSTTQAISDFAKALTSAVAQSRAFNESTNWVSTRKQAFTDLINGFTTTISEEGGVLGYLTKVGNKISEISGTLGDNLTNNINDSIFGTVVDDPYNEQGRGERRSGGALEFLDKSKVFLIGAAIASAVVAVLPAELTGGAVYLAFLGLGYAIITGLGVALTAALSSGLVLSIAAVALLPTALNTLNEGLPFGISTRSIGRAIGEGIVNFFKDDAEGKGVGTKILQAILDSMREFGLGLKEGLNLDLPGFTGAIEDRIIGGISLAIAGITVSGILRNGVIGLAKRIGVALFGVAFGSAATTSLGTQLKSIFTDIDDEELKTKAKGKGAILGKAFSAGLRGGLAFQAVDVGSDLLFANIGDKQKDVYETLLSDFAAGAAGGAAAGAIFGPIGAALGAILVGSITAIWRNAEVVQSAITWAADTAAELEQKINDAVNKFFTETVPEFAKNIGDSFAEGLSNGWDSVKTSISDFFSGLNPFGFFSSGGSVEKKAYGGYITGPGGPKDDKIPAMLSNGEFVIQASAVKKLGRNFLQRLNSGMISGFAGGSDDRLTVLQARKERIKQQQAKTKDDLLIAEWEQDQTLINIAARKESILNRQLQQTEAMIDMIMSDPTSSIDLGSLSKVGEISETEKIGENYAESFKDDFNAGLKRALKTGDFKQFGKDLLDSITSRIIDSFVDGLTESLFSGLTSEGGLFSNLFEGVYNFGSNLGSGTVSAVKSGIGSGVSGTSGGGFSGGNFNMSKALQSTTGAIQGFGSGIGNLIGNFKGLFSGLFGGIKSLFSGLLNSLLGLNGGGGLFSSLFGMSFGSTLGFTGPIGFNQGGIVPNTPYSKRGMDSVPAMLTPGEMIIPADRVKSMNNNNNKNQAVFNFNITGDVSRQTRKEIVSLMPTIATGVNAQNKERNFRYR